MEEKHLTWAGAAVGMSVWSLKSSNPYKVMLKVNGIPYDAF